MKKWGGKQNLVFLPISHVDRCLIVCYSKNMNADMAERDAHTLILTPIGSHLYGLAHAGSDRDFYRVVTDAYFASHNRGGRKAAHKITAESDEVTVPLGKFSQFAFSGYPQALEAMFSEQTTIDRMSAFRDRFYAGIGMDSMRERYRKTIRNFAHGDFKHRRHAMRLSINLDQARISGGRFNPTLTADQAEFITAAAGSTPEQFIAALESLNHYQIADSFNMEEIADSFAKEAASE